MTNREMVKKIIAEMSDEEIEQFYRERYEPQEYETICEYCDKKFGCPCNILSTAECRVTATEWLNSEAVKK